MEIDNAELISLILSKPAIWDSKNVHHKNKSVVMKCWEEIGRHFGNVEVTFIKKRWKNLKDQYRKELKKLQFSSGNAGDNIQSTWYFFQQMNFMRFEILPDTSDTNLTTVDSQLPNTSMSSPCLESNSPAFVIRDSDITRCSPTDSESSQKVTSVGGSEVRTTNTPLSNNTAGSSSRYLKRKSANNIEMEIVELEKKRLLLLENDLQQNSNANQSGEKSEDYYYLMSLLPQMESFTPLQKFKVRNRIDQVMMEEIHNTMNINK